MKIMQTSYRNKQWLTKIDKEWDSKNSLAVVYFSPKLANSQVWKELKASLPNSLIIGCSGAGEVKGSELVDDEAVVTITKFSQSSICYASVTLSDAANSELSGQKLVEQFPPSGLKAIYVLSDGLHVNGSALINGMRKVVGENVVISGGLAADGTNFKNTYVLAEGMPQQNTVVAVGFYGANIKVTASSQGGWKSFGPPRKITKSKSNIVYELDNKPALALYKEFLGDQANKLPASALLFPLHLGPDSHAANRDLVRTILAVDETTQSMTFAGDVPEGTTVQLMRATHEGLVGAAASAAKQNSLQFILGAPALSLMVSCVGRRLVLGENTEAEIEAVVAELPNNVIQTGFYSYGEIAPGNAGVCDLHNQTMTLTLIQEKEAA